MTKDEVEVVAAELAKAGGLSWYPERNEGPLRALKERYRNRARLVIAALDRHRVGTKGLVSASHLEEDSSVLTGESSHSVSVEGAVTVGGTVLYRPPGDRRAYLCRIDKVEGSRAYLVPEIKTCTGWIDIRNLLPDAPGEAPEP